MMLRKKFSSISQYSVAAVVCVVAFAVGVDSVPGYAQEIHPDLYRDLPYRFVGPQGNRTISVAGVPGEPMVYYVGAASGGIWKSTDGASNWEPIFDDQPAQSIGSLEVAPSDPNIVWAGTGEPYIRANVSIGNGIYKSIDAGKTWKHMGLEKTGRVGRIVIDPRDPNVVFAAALGHCYGPQPERGVFRTTDGGETWEKVLFVDENTGASDVVMDPADPQKLLAGMWQLEIKTWGRWSGGPGSGLFMSRDGGTTWKRLTGHGLPDLPMGKIGIAFAPSRPERVYAMIETADGYLWRSDDGGESWKLVNSDHKIMERPHYYTRLMVAPDDENEVYFLAERFARSFDGGENIHWVSVPRGDTHDMWIDPLDPDRMMYADDVGVLISVNRYRTWHRVRLPIAQIYHVAVDNRIPYYIYGNEQDFGSRRAPSNSLFARGGIPSGLWHEVGGSESGFAVPDLVDTGIVWSGSFNGGLDRFDLETGHSRSVRVWPKNPTGWPAGKLKYRFNWTFPIAISPHDHNRVYVGSQHVHQTTNGGQSWTVISPDLSTNNQELLLDSGGITVDNLGVEYGCIIFALAESPLEEGLIWAGTNDGQVQVTRDGGTSWTNVTAALPDLPPLGTVSNIEPSRYDGGTAYLTVDFHQVNNRDPYIYKTADYGQSWKLISSDIPKSVFSYAHCVREDPKRKGLLYAGTENAVYVSFNDGANWLPLQNNLPHAPAHWLAIQENFNDLVVATYGRGFWVMDDITPLQQVTSEVLRSDAHLFAPRQAYRFQKIKGTDTSPHDHSVGQNPPDGGSINYYLKAAPGGDVQITILDETGQNIRQIEGTANPGINRIWWDLRYEPTKQARLRTKPAGHDHVRFNDEGWRPVGYWDAMGRGLLGPMALPGTYRVKLTVNGQELTENLTVLKDPNTTGSEEDVRVKVKRLLEIRDNINTVVDMINQTEWLRKQVRDIEVILAPDSAHSPIVDAAKELDGKLLELEVHLFQTELSGGKKDAFREPTRLYSHLAMLATDMGSASALGFSSSADYPPTDQQIAVHEELKKELADAQSRFEALLNTEVSGFNRLLRERNVPNIISAVY